MEYLEVVRLKVCWGCDIEEELDSLGEGKDALREYLRDHTSYDKDSQVSVFNNNAKYFQEAYSIVRPFAKQIPGPISFDIVYYAQEGGQDLYGRSTWDLDEIDEDEDLPKDLVDIVSVNDFVYPENWFAEWVSDHEEETEEWLAEHGDEDNEFDFGADRWRKFADDFPEAEKEFFEMLEDL